MGVSCSADRNIKAKINKDGIWIEKMDANPSELIPEEYCKPGEGAKGIEIDLDKGIDAVRAELTKYPVSTRVSFEGHHHRGSRHRPRQTESAFGCWRGNAGILQEPPDSLRRPAKTPEGYLLRQHGPTTANRMDPYVDEFQSKGASW